MEKPPRLLSPLMRDFLFTTIFAILLFYMLPYHEIWRDEMHDLSMVMSWKSLPDLLKNTMTFGFPALWYLVLFVGYHLTQTVLILKFMSIFFVSVAIFLFLRFSPFSRFEKIIFLFGYFPFYEYSIISRSYCLSLALLFGVCTFYPRRLQNLVPLAVTAFFLANTNAHSLVLTIALLASFVIETVLNNRSIHNLKNWIAGLWILIAGIAVSLFQIRPDPNSIIKYYELTSTYLFQAFGVALLNPGGLFSHAFGFMPEFLSLSLWIFYLGSFRRNIPTASFFFLSALGLGLFFLTVYPGMTRHQGFLIMAMIAMIWMERSSAESRVRGNESFILRYRNAFFLIVLVMQVVLSSKAIIRDLALPYSSSADFAAFLRRDPKLREAILVPEPDYFAEPMPFYVSNPIYMTREHKFSNYIHFTTANDRELSLGALLDTAQKLQKEQQKNVVIMLGHRNLSPQGPFELSFSYGKIFRYSPEELARLQRETIPISQFRDALGDENYDIYLLKGN